MHNNWRNVGRQKNFAKHFLNYVLIVALEKILRSVQKKTLNFFLQ